MSKILIFHGGSIGDTLMAFPAIQAVRNNHPDATIDLFSCPGVDDFSYLNFYENTNLIDHVHKFYIPPQPLRRIRVYAKLFAAARRGKYDMVVCLLPWHRNEKADHWFFRLAGVKKVVYPISLPAHKNITLPRVPVLMLHGLKTAGFAVPPEDAIKIDLQTTPAEQANADTWFQRLQVPYDKIPVAVGMGGKKPVCHWPIEKYRQALQELTANNRIYPIFFGGKSDETAVRPLLQELGCGAFAADGGKLSLRETVAAMTKCKLFIGNDSGTVHLAAAAGLPIVGVYSAHNYDGLWHPLGNRNAILRAKIECAGCDLLVCPKGSPAVCIDQINASDVIEAARRLLN